MHLELILSDDCLTVRKPGKTVFLSNTKLFSPCVLPMPRFTHRFLGHSPQPIKRHTNHKDILQRTQPGRGGRRSPRHFSVELLLKRIPDQQTTTPLAAVVRALARVQSEQVKNDTNFLVIREKTQRLEAVRAVHIYQCVFPTPNDANPACESWLR